VLDTTVGDDVGDSATGRVRTTVAVLVALASVGAGGWATQVPAAAAVELWQVVVVVSLLPLSEIAMLRVRIGHHHLSFTWGEACVVLGLVLLGPAWLVLVSGPVVAAMHLALGRGPLKAVANGAVFSLGCSAAGLVMLVSGPPPYLLTDLREAAALLGAVALWSLVSAGCTGLLIARAQDMRLRAVVRHSLQPLLMVFAGNVALAAGVLVLVARRPSTLLLLPPVMLAVYLVYRGYLAARQERDIWRQLEAATRELNVLEEEQVAAAALARACQLFRVDGAELLVARGASRPGRLYHLDPGGGLAVRPVEPGEETVGTTAYVKLDASARVEPVLTCLSAPLEGPRGRIGSLRLLFGGPVRLSPRERQVLSTFAHAVSTTLLNAALHDDVRAEAKRKAYEASHDHLTGLANRSLLSFSKKAAVAAAEGTTALLLLDLDHFKEINDTLGHAAGDVILQEVARRLRGFAGDRHLVGRLGGDEFAVLLTRLAGPADAEPVAEAVLSLLNEPVEFEGLRLSVEASLGVACHPADAATSDELFRRADVAMYQAKSTRGQWLRYSADRDDSSVHRQALVAELRAGLELDQLVVHYQPQVDLESGLLVGAEALCRWEHPTRGLLPPAEFVSVAEHSGLVRPFTLRVLDQAAAQCVRWQDHGRPVSVAVNLSARSLLDRQLPQDVAAVLARHDLPPDRLVLEITETTATSELEVVEEVLTQLREMGVELSVDDFGTGYSSLAFLQRTAVHELKVDRAFVSGMLHSENDLALVRATVQLARSLGARSVAEGVEDGAQAAALREMGCDVAQGFWLSRPVPAEKMRGLLGLRVTAESAGTRLPSPREGGLRVLRPSA
jgi:diguanylate cyclase